MTQSNVNIGTITARLTDPNKAAANPRQLMVCQEKISQTLTRLFKFPQNGGNPFLFALAGPKPHFLAKELPGMKDFKTAATDGKNFFWHPDFLESLSADQAATVMSHESYHVLFFHCVPERAGGLDAHTWNLAIDYVVNGTIETEHEQSKRSSVYKLWEGPLGTPIPFQHYLEWVDGSRDTLPEPCCFADVTTFGRSPESIYDEMRKHQMQSPRRCKEHQGGCGSMVINPKTGLSTIPLPWGPECCQLCGAKPGEGRGPGSLDAHLPPSQSRDETFGDMMRAADQTRAMGRGDVPAGIEAALGRLKKPELSARDIIRMAIAQKRADAGNIIDWKRIRRRPTYMHVKNPETGKYEPKHRIYIPKKHDFHPKWVCLLDTSGSMSDDDIVNGVKELQLVADIAEGWIVPCDATPYWDKATKITNKTALTRTQVHGRGGTVFEEFFRDMHKHECGKNVDLVIMLTDGDCGQIPMHLAPPGADVLWIITNKREFKPNFGRVCQLRPSRQLPIHAIWQGSSRSLPYGVERTWNVPLLRNPKASKADSHSSQ